MALEFVSQFVPGGAVCEGDVIVGNVVEEMDLFLLEHDSRSNRVDGSITPAFVEEAAVLVEGLKKVQVCLGSKPVQVANFKVGPLW